jgi:type III pantothenate kinase
MLLLDIGNTNIKLFDGKESLRYPLERFHFPKERFCYINVNPNMHERVAQIAHAVDLKPYFSFRTDYEGLGVDRVAACYSVADGVVVDAGSAITVDRMRNGVHEGGFILPGFSATKDSFANISPKLIYDLKNEIALNRLPLSTQDALLYATIKPVILAIESTAEDLPIYLTGGDGKELLAYLPKAIYRENLVFEGMQRVIKEKNLPC